jgi:Lon protease-like protein
VPEIGLFPLGMVLLPTERVPLHVFEPRYRELIGECLEHGTEFGLVYVAEEGMHAVGTRASVIEVTERFADGRLDILVRGGARFRLVRLTDGRSFHTGLVEDVADEPAPVSEADSGRARRLFTELAELTGADSAVPEAGDHELSFALAARFDFSAELKQALLQETSERDRLARLCELFVAAAQAVVRQREVAARARSNGHAQPGPRSA